jgi:hypothetical protein
VNFESRDWIHMRPETNLKILSRVWLGTSSAVLQWDMEDFPKGF